MNSYSRQLSVVLRFFSLFLALYLLMAGSGLAEELELDIKSAEAGQTVVFTISVNNAPNLVLAFGFRVLFDGNCLTWQSLTVGDLTQDFAKLDPATGDPTGAIVANEPWPGTLIVGGATAFPENGIQQGETGVLATLTFTVDSCCSTALTFSELNSHLAPPSADHVWTTKNGQFFCGDVDLDGINDDTDNCVTVFNTDQADTDNDGYGDACDGCPDDPNKIAPGVCGCGLADTDSDGDWTADCNDLCPDDPGKTKPGVCGCGVSDRDSDFDGTPDCLDNCPDDADKTEPGACGCGNADTDTDGDGTADCLDGCPDDPDKTAPGVCGCGTPDTDSNNDGTPDCNDANDDSDFDGIKDKHDNCPAVANPDQADADADGIGDACDACPNDPNKAIPGACGCGNPDTDSDGDGTADCNDACPKNPDKTEPGVCGCSKPDIDKDGDGDIDCPSHTKSSLEELFGCFIDTLGR